MERRYLYALAEGVLGAEELDDEGDALGCDEGKLGEVEEADGHLRTSVHKRKVFGTSWLYRDSCFERRVMLVTLRIDLYNLLHLAVHIEHGHSLRIMNLW